MVNVRNLNLSTYMFALGDEVSINAQVGRMHLSERQINLCAKVLQPGIYALSSGWYWVPANQGLYVELASISIYLEYLDINLLNQLTINSASLIWAI